MKLTILLTAILVGTASQSMAGPYQKNSLQVGASFGASTVIGQEQIEDQSKTGFATGGFFQYQATPFMGLGLSYDYVNLGLSDDFSHLDDVDGNIYSFNLSFNSTRSKRVIPFIKLGVGAAAMHDVIDERFSYTNLAYKGVMGIDFVASHRTTIGAHFNYHYITTTNTSQKEVHLLNPVLGLTFHLGGSKTAAKKNTVNASGCQCPPPGAPSTPRTSAGYQNSGAVKAQPFQPVTIPATEVPQWTSETQNLAD